MFYVNGSLVQRELSAKLTEGLLNMRLENKVKIEA